MKIERLMLKLRDLAVRATYRSNAPLATPDEFGTWAKDLRRGQMTVIGSLKRFVDLLEARGMGQAGRELAREAWAIGEEYIDLTLPPETVAAKPLNTRDVDISSETRAVRLSRGVNYGPMSERVSNRSA